MPLNCGNSFNTVIHEIDSQHREFFSRLDKLDDARTRQWELQLAEDS